MSIVDDGFVDGPEWRYTPRGVQGLVRAGGRVTFTTHHEGTQVEYVRRGRPWVHRGPGEFAGSIRFARALKSDRRLVDMLARLKRAASRLGLPRAAHETAAIIIRLYLREGKPLREKMKNALVAAALHRAVMAHNLDTPLSRILEVLGVTEQELWQAKRKLAETGAASIARGVKGQLDRVAVYTMKIVGTLNLPPVVYRASMEFVRTVVENNKSLIGKRPEIIAAASVYLVARLYGYENVTQKVVAEIVGAKERNVRNMYHYLTNSMVILVEV